MMIVQYLLAVAMTIQTQQVPVGGGNDPITIVETGVARTYEATKNISCGNVEWGVRWQAGGESGQIRGTVAVTSGNRTRAVQDAQARIFDRFIAVSDVSATCNPSVDGQPLRTSLLISGTDRDNIRILAQVILQRDLETSLSINPAG